MQLLDDKMFDALADEPNVAIPWFLITSHLYYHRNESIISDGAFDQLGRFIREHWKYLEHRHKKLLKRGSLNTGFYLLERRLPTIVKSAAVRLLDEAHEARPKRLRPRLSQERQGRLF